MYRTQTLWSHCNLILRAFCHCVNPAPRREEEVQSAYQRNAKLIKKLDTVTKIRIVNDLFECLKQMMWIKLGRPDSNLRFGYSNPNLRLRFESET